jgi:serine/threonine protein kinase
MFENPKKFPVQLGRYKLTRLISRGGMAYVYEGRRESMAGVSPKVAIKMILPDKAADEAYKDLFITEAKVSSTLMHRNLVHIQDFDELDGSFFLVMEYVEGVTLRDAIRIARQHGIPIPVHVIAEVGRQICEGLHHAHQATTNEGRPLGLVHCDIKPSNIIVNSQGMIKVLDFGVSQASISPVNNKALRGTWGYMAPEQMENDLVSPRTDLFSLAIVLYEMASLKPMFGKKEKNNHKEMKKMLKGDEAARRANSLSGLNNALISHLVRALQRDQSGRYLSADEMGTALTSLVPDPVTARNDLNSFLVKVEDLKRSGKRTDSISPAEEMDDFSGQPVQGTKIRVKRSDEDKKRRFGLVFLLFFPLVLVSSMYGIFTYSSGTEPKAPDATSVSPKEPDSKLEIIEETKSEGNFDAVKPKPKPKKKKKPKKKVAPDPVEIEVEEEPIEEIVVPEPDVRIAPEPRKVEPSGVGRITISADQSAKVFIDGKPITQAPLYKYEISAGEHRIHIARENGQIKKFTVNVNGGDSLIYQWSFADGRWLRSGN